MTRIVAPFLRMLYRPVVSGLENMPADEPVIVASNHLSFVDSVLIPLVVPRRVTFLAKAEYFEGKGPARLLGSFLSAMGHIPVPRSEQRAAVAALNVGLDILRDGGAFAIYPEGTRSEDGRLYRGHTGVAFLALSSGAPIIPIAVRGTDRIMPVGAKLPRLRYAGIRVGKPVDPGRFADMPSARARRMLTDDVMHEIQALSGQEYTGTFNERSRLEG
jgi:1-acyl-sn-glycerol-3-phosphate acyltransferase